MNTIKVVNKSGISQLILKSLKGQQLNENEVYSINSDKVDGLIHLDVLLKGTSFKLIYDITGFITFREYLATPLNKEKFARILQNILSNLKSLECAFFKQQYLLLDVDRVLVNPITNRIYFIYVPIQQFESGTYLREFLLNIIQHSSFAAGEDASYVKDYITIFNRGVNFSVFDLEEYASKLLGQSTSVQQSIECPQCHTRLKKGTIYCPACGAKISGNTGNSSSTGNVRNTVNTQKGMYNPLDVEEKKNETAIKQEQRKNADKQGMSDRTTAPDADSGGTIMLGFEEYKPDYPHLIREKTGEKIVINKPAFRIGKKNNNDYSVSDNDAVSRSHANIITREKRYFIVDLHSTNKTYVDGRVIPADKETEIFSGAKLRLADENFVFYIE